MAKPGELNWDYLMKNGHIEQDPVSKAITDQFSKGSCKDTNKGGEEVTKEELKKEAMDIVKQAHVGSGRQATDEELFGHLVKTQEEADKIEKEWNDKINDFYKAASKPIENKKVKKTSWGTGGKFNDSLTPEELAKRNMHTGE